MAVSQNINIAYSLNQPLSAIFPNPIISARNPLTTDKAQLGTLWINRSGNAAWVLTSIIANSANWVDIVESGGAGSFSTLTVTGNADIGTDSGADVVIGNDLGDTSVTINSGSADIVLATNTGGDISLSGTDVSINGDTFTMNATPVIEIGDGVATAITIGNTTTTSSIDMHVGAGNFSLNGVAASTYTVGAATTTGTITIGGTAQTGDMVLGSSSGTNAVKIANGAGASTVSIAEVQTAGAVNIGAAMTTGTIRIGGTGLQTGTITIGGGTGAQIVNVGTGGTGAKAVNIATGAAANVTIIGTTTAASTLALNTPTGTPVVAANGLTATAGNLTTTNGNVVLSTAATYVQLPGPIKIMSGAGDPANGLAAEAGDLYIRTDPAGATSRIFVATAANTWTNVTCAA